MLEVATYSFSGFAARRWSQIVCVTGPSPRSGHRAVVWKHFMVCVGSCVAADARHVYPCSYACACFDESLLLRTNRTSLLCLLVFNT